jgi:hypothetical protein
MDVEASLLELTRLVYGHPWENPYDSLDELFRTVLRSFQDPAGYEEWEQEQLRKLQAEFDAESA